MLPETKGRVFFWLGTPARPLPSPSSLHPYQLEPGSYEVELLLTGENVKPVLKRVGLAFSGRWSTDEEAMIESIKITQ